MKIKRNDWILFGIILVVSFAMAVIYYVFPRDSGDSVSILIDGNIEQTLSLNQDTVFTIQIGEYQNVLQIKDGFASIIEANCPDKLCVSQHRISKKGESLICLPHKLVIRVENEGSDEEFDGIVQ